jgi:hypothetical protein
MTMFYEEIAPCQFRKEKERSMLSRFQSSALSGQATKRRIVGIRDYFTAATIIGTGHTRHDHEPQGKSLAS